MGVTKGYRKTTSKRYLREQFQRELEALPVGDSRRITVLRSLSKLDGYDLRMKAVDYPDRHKKKDEPAAQPAAPTTDDGDEPLSEELQARFDNCERLERAWAAYKAGKPLPSDAPAVVRAVAQTRERGIQ